jgi:L-amino acid N-acyltransferase YncA
MSNRLISATNDIEHVNCPVCERDNHVIWMEDGKPTRYVRCQTCGTVYASPRVSNAVRYTWLNTTFGVSKQVMELTEGRRPALEKEASIIQRIKGKGKMLDIGCSTGAFFEYFDKTRWERYGVELSPSAAVYASETIGAQVHTGTLRSANYPDNYFDLVTMIDMFYYVDDPRSELQEVARVLHPKGLVAIEIAGQAYMLARSRGILCFLSEGRWTRLNTDSAYLYWYSPKSLEKLLNIWGLQVIDWQVIESPERIGIRGWVSSRYGWVMGGVTRRWPYFLTWAPKYLCLARPTVKASIKGKTPTPSRLPTQVVIRRADESHISDIVGLHKEYVSEGPEWQREMTERQFLSDYYRYIIHLQNSAVYVALSDQRVIGYVALVLNQGRILLKLSLGSPGTFVNLDSFRTLLSFRMLKLIYSKFLHEIIGEKWRRAPGKYRSAYELRSIAVFPDHRRLSVGTSLLNTLLADAVKRKCIPIITWVDETNVASTRLFEKVGFRKVGNRDDPHGKVQLFTYDVLDRAN